MVRVALIVPSPAMRAGLCALLSSDEEIEIVNESSVWENSLDEQVEQTETDVVITTSVSVDSFSDEETSAASVAAILFLRDDPLNVQRMMRLPYVWGVLPLDTSAEELCVAVHALSQGLIVGARPLISTNDEDNNSAPGPLTDREAEVLTLLSKGLANKQIAVKLGISEHTVKFHVSSIYTKLSVTNRAQAIREGLRNGWIVL